MIFWVVMLNRLYLTQWNINGVALDRDLQRAFRYQNERMRRLLQRKSAAKR